MSRPLESYSSEVLATFIERRGISYFPELLDSIEQEIANARFQELFGRPIAPPPAAGRCGACKGIGRLPFGEYCSCKMGRDLCTVESRPRAPWHGPDPNGTTLDLP